MLFNKDMWILYALLAAISAAMVVVLTKAGLKDIDSTAAFAVQAVIIIIVSWSVVFIQPDMVAWRTIKSKTWIILICAGLATTLSTLFSYKALSLGPASYVVTIERTSLVIAVALAIIFLKEKIDLANYCRLYRYHIRCSINRFIRCTEVKKLTGKMTSF